MFFYIFFYSILVYVDIGEDNSPTTLSVITSGPTYARSWKVKITQVRCYRGYDRGKMQITQFVKLDRS